MLTTSDTLKQALVNVRAANPACFSSGDPGDSLRAMVHLAKVQPEAFTNAPGDQLILMLVKQELHSLSKNPRGYG